MRRRALLVQPIPKPKTHKSGPECRFVPPPMSPQRSHGLYERVFQRPDRDAQDGCALASLKPTLFPPNSRNAGDCHHPPDSRGQDPEISCRGHGLGNRFRLLSGAGPKPQRVRCKHGAWITEYLPESRRLRALAFWMKDGFLEHFEHSIDGRLARP